MPETGREGLSTAEADARLARYGPNEVPEEKRHPLVVLLGYFWAPIPWMIEVALVLSLLSRNFTDAAIVAVLLALNGFVAYTEEHQAENAIAALTRRLAPTATAWRDGRWQVVAARTLVPGDVVRLRLGDVVPADARLLDEGPVQLDQSAITGESLPVARVRGDALLSGSVVVQGETDALVEATGARSLFGRTTALVARAGAVSHFQRAVLRIGTDLIVAAGVLLAVTVAVSLARGTPALETLELALVVSIASVPVALPAVLSVTMAVGARHLARRNAVVRHLPAVEELGGIDVLCSDKTGTLTENRLAAGAPWCAPGVAATDVVEAAMFASRPEDRDPIDRAVHALGAGVPAPEGRVERFVPFDPVRKRAEALVTRPDGTRLRVTKGAPQVVTALCSDDPCVPAALAQVETLARRGARALAVARTRPDGRFGLLGILPLADPPRDDSAATIEAARRLGVDVKMVTGDQLAIGAEIARRVGLGSDLLPAERLDAPGRTDEGRADLVEAADGFAQVFPEHKHRIVALLQARGHIVGMTGDGVNDAPALRQADAGIAVAGATDAARAAADVVLLAPGLSVIVEAIRLAREIFARMTSYAIYRIAETIRVLLLVVVVVVADGVFPVSATMIVLLAILNDAAILAIAFDRVRASDRPAAWDLRSVIAIALVIGALGVAETYLLFVLARDVAGLTLAVARTLVYLKLSVSGHCTVFVTRAKGPLWSPPAPSRLLLGAVVGTQVLATLIAGFGLFVTPLPWTWVGLVWAYALVWFLVEDRVKLATYTLLARRPAP